MISFLKMNFRNLIRAARRNVRVGDTNFKVYGIHSDRIALNEGGDDHLIVVIRRLLEERQGAFIDVGANCGQTLSKVIEIKITQEYIGFEPQIDCCFHINRFLANNELSNAKILPIALSDTDKISKIHFDKPLDVTASLLPTQFDSEIELREFQSWIVVRSGDTVLKEMAVQQVCAIKVDVEGSELDVLKGLRQTLLVERPPVLFELLMNRRYGELFPDQKLRSLKQRQADDLLNFLHERSYLIYRIDALGNEHRVDSVDLDCEVESPFTNDGRDFIARYAENSKPI